MATMPTSLRERVCDTATGAGSESGFDPKGTETGATLAEMLLVVAITAMAAGLVVGRGTPGQHRIERAALQSLVRSVRADAMRSDRIVSLEAGEDGHSLLAAGKTLVFDLDHQVFCTASDGGKAITFGPDGSSNGGLVRVLAPGSEDRLVVEPVTGALQP